MRRTRLALAIFIIPFGILLAQKPKDAPELEIFPKHFLLQPGEQIHYQVRARDGNGSKDVAEYKFTIDSPDIVRPVPQSKGALFVEAIRPGRSEIQVRSSTSEARMTIDVAGPMQSPMQAVPYTGIKEIKAKELLFVGHANLDGFDHTAVAKPAIDSLVKEARQKGVPVVYFVSAEYPDWYTADRRPDYAIISEGQEHEVFANADRVTFTGGDYMACTLRNVQMTLHAMVKHGKQHIQFVFPAQAIWVQDQWWPGAKQPYPAPMLTLSSIFARRNTDAQSYEQVVVPFLDRMINEFPVWNYPSNPPKPQLNDLLKNWDIAVRFNSRFERTYRRGDANKTLVLEFQGI
jgi:hypothetical protein